jgi:hypothetical protein
MLKSRKMADPRPTYPQAQKQQWSHATGRRTDSSQNTSGESRFRIQGQWHFEFNPIPD